MPSETTSATSTPTHTLSESWKQVSAAVRAEVTTDTPADRSNSPPIINRATPTATIPMVEEAYSTVPNEGSVRNGGATEKKKMKMTIAAAIAPNSGRVRIREANDRCGLVLSAVSGGLVVTGVLMWWLPRTRGDRPREGSSALPSREARSAGVLLRVRQD